MIVEERRGGYIEASHTVSAVLVDDAGVVRERVGEDLVTTWRSAAKPFQLASNLTALSAEQVGELAAADLALGSASHSGQERHIARIEVLLEKFGLDQRALYCGAHWPIHEPSARAVVDLGQIHNNCSGKHTFMAAAARALGGPEDYRDPDHVVQRRIRALMERCMAGGIVAGVVDGCGVPCWVSPMSSMARAWAGLGDLVEGRLAASMQSEWWFVSGSDRDDGQLLAYSTGPLVAKVGAKGLMCLSVPDQRLGIAVKVHSGSADARAVAVHAVLERWFPGLVGAAAVQPWTVVRNVVGDVVGDRIVRMN